VAGSCEYGDEPSGSGATELVIRAFGNSKKPKKQTLIKYTRKAGAKEERKYSSYSFLTSALDGVSGERHVPAVFYPWRLGGPQSWSGHSG
jgi:hypothetical protein